MNNNNNNKDTIQVKYLTLTRLKAEYSNLLIIIAGCAALNQQLHWENARELMFKYQEKAKESREINARGEGNGSRLNTVCVILRAVHFPISAMHKKE